MCFAGALSVFIFSGHAAEVGLDSLAPLVKLLPFSLSFSFAQAVIVAATVYHAGVVTSQIGNALACRSDRIRSARLGLFSNKYLWLGILLELAGIICIVYLPLFADIFNHASLPLWMWIGLSLNPLVLYSMEWIRKSVVRIFYNLRTPKPSSLTPQEVN